MIDINCAPVCGIYCSDCNFLGIGCTGCGNMDGKPFRSTSMKIEI